MADLFDAPELDKQRLIGACARLPLTIDIERLRGEVDALPHEAWVSTGDRVGVHRAAGALFLRGYAPAEGERPIEDRPALDGLPYCRALIHETLGAPPLRCLLARLPGGERIPAHSDTGPYFVRTLRVHVPVSTHPKAWMLCDGQSYVMAAGEAWALNNSARHGVWNADPRRARTHLICDFLAGAGLLDLLARGERDLGRRLDYVEQEIGARRPARV